jgi:hypothetical protein
MVSAATLEVLLGLESRRYGSEALPVPLEPAVNWSQSTFTVAVQLQLLAVVMVIVPVPPVAGYEAVVGETVKEHDGVVGVDGDDGDFGASGLLPPPQAAPSTARTSATTGTTRIVASGVVGCQRRGLQTRRG